MNELTEDDALAAELVIGTLDAAERETAEARVRRDPAFAALVEAWAEQLAPLLEAVDGVTPPGTALQSILAQIDLLRRDRDHAPGGGRVIQLRREVRAWRAATAVATALAAALGLWIVVPRAAPRPQDRTFMAVLQKNDAGPAFLVSLDLDHRRMTVVPASSPEPGDQSMELWMIGSQQGTPQSLGLIDASAPVRTVLPDVGADQISRATYAVTLEPQGGSPTGKPTSPPILAGHLVEEPR